MTKYEEYKEERERLGLYYVPEETWNLVIGRGDYEPDPRIRPYLDALLHDSPHASISHYALHTLNTQHGEVTIAGLLAEHWSFIREQSK